MANLQTDSRVKQWVDSYARWFDDDGALEKGKMTGNLYPYTAMFSPIQINRTTVKNRLVMAPMGNICMCEETGRPNDKMIQYFIERAKGGVGLITSGLIPVSFGIDNSIIELDKLSYFPRIDRSRTVFAAWRDLAAGVPSAYSRPRTGGESPVPGELPEVPGFRIHESQLLHGAGALYAALGA